MNGGKNASGYPDPTATIAIGNVYREQRKEQRMNRNSQQGGGINRKTYKDIKKYDRQQMEDFWNRIHKSGYDAGYDDGYAAGKEAVPQPDTGEIIRDLTDDLMDVISRTKGVGAKTLERIREEIDREFAKGKEETAK